MNDWDGEVECAQVKIIVIVWMPTMGRIMLEVNDEGHFSNVITKKKLGTQAEWSSLSNGTVIDTVLWLFTELLSKQR